MSYIRIRLSGSCSQLAPLLLSLNAKYLTGFIFKLKQRLRGKSVALKHCVVSIKRDDDDPPSTNNSKSLIRHTPPLFPCGTVPIPSQTCSAEKAG